MQERGSLDQIIEKYSTPLQICPDMTGKPLGLNSCITAFLVLICGASTGLILLALELCCRKNRMKWTWLDAKPSTSMQKKTSM